VGNDLVEKRKEDENTTEDTEIIDEIEEKTVEAVAEEVIGEQVSTEEIEEAEEVEEAEEAEKAEEVEEVEKAEEVEEVEKAEEAEEIEEDELSRLTKQLQAREQEAKEHYEARLRLQAEFGNFKKRQEKEILNFRKYANEGLIQDILPIVDDFERAITAAEQSHKLEDFLKGVELIFSKFLDVLQKKGIKEIEAEGQPFNPEIHEAVTHIETDDVEEGMVAQVFQKGYYLHDRVIRAPKVGVAKKKE